MQPGDVSIFLGAELFLGTLEGVKYFSISGADDNYYLRGHSQSMLPHLMAHSTPPGFMNMLVSFFSP